MESRKCPNCGGELELSRSKTMLECPYCGSKFDIDTDDRKKISKGTRDFDEEYFHLERDFTEARKKKQTGKCIETVIYCMNELGTPERVENHIRKGLISGSDTAAEGINDKALNAVRSRIDSERKEDERIILYKDMGIFSKGKEFTVVTDKRLLFFTKKKCASVSYTDIGTLRLDDNLDCAAWYINGDLDLRIPSMEPS